MKAKRKNVGGRPSKLTPQVLESISAVLRAGNYVETAAAFAGIDKVTLYDWMRQGARARAKGHETGIYARFSHAIEKAMADAETVMTSAIFRAGRGHEDTPGQWQALAWLLERKHPDKWGRRQRLDIAGADDTEPLRIVVDLGTGKPTD